MTTNTENIWKTLQDEALKEQPQPDEKTASQFRKETGLSRYKVEIFLAKQIEVGTLKMREINGVRYFSPA